MNGHTWKYLLGVGSVCIGLLSCNPSNALTNAYNIPYNELQNLPIKLENNGVIETAISSKAEMVKYIDTANIQDTSITIHPINFKKECIALIAYPTTDINAYISIDMLEQKIDTLRIYYSYISSNERLNEDIRPYKAIRLRKKHKHLQIIKNM